MAAVRRNHGSVIRHMRVFLIALCACGASTAGAPPQGPTPISAKPKGEAHAPVDVIATLAKPLVASAWIAPGAAQLVLGGAPLQALEGAPSIEVDMLEEQGNDVRVGVRLEHARFALWTARSRLLAIIARDHRLELPGVFAIGGDPMQVVLRAGAQVQRIAVKDKRTRVRYVGAFEVEGWVPNEVLTDRGSPGRSNRGRVPTSRKQMHLLPGAVIRVEAKWAAQQLAVLNEGYVVDEIKPIDDAWSEVGFEDSDLYVHGYVSKRDPPGRTHRKKSPEQIAPLVPNVNANDGTCLYVGGEEIGFIVGTQAVLVEKASRAGWFALTIETPWGPLSFDAKGPTETELVKCGG